VSSAVLAGVAMTLLGVVFITLGQARKRAHSQKQTV
jgi:hypothetical protein